MNARDPSPRRIDPQDRNALHAAARNLARIGDLYGAYELLFDAGLVAAGEPYALELGAALAARERPVFEALDPFRFAYGVGTTSAPSWADEARELPLIALVLDRDRGAAELARFAFLRGVNFLQMPQASQATINALGGCPRLAVLSFSDVGLGGLDLAPLSRPPLRRLEIGEGALDDAALAGLAGLTGLHRLDLALCPFVGPGLKHLSGMSELRQLDLSYNSLRGESLEVLASFSKLERLGLAETGDRGGELSVLESCPSLRRLHIEWCGLSPEGLSALGQLSWLEELSLSGAEIGDEDLTALAGMSRLRSLNLNCSGITDRALPALARLPALEDLILWANPEITARGLEALAAAPKLKGLKITNEAFSDRLAERLSGVLIHCA